VYLRGGASGVAEGAAVIGGGVEPGRGGPRRGRVGVGGGEEARGVAADAHGRGEAARRRRRGGRRWWRRWGQGLAGTRGRVAALRGLGNFWSASPPGLLGEEEFSGCGFRSRSDSPPFAFFCAVLSVTCVVYFSPSLQFLIFALSQKIKFLRFATAPCHSVPFFYNFNFFNKINS
jgi:hypothetical protein